MLNILTFTSSVKGEVITYMAIKIDELKCTGCGACIYACPVAVLEIDDMKCRLREGCISCGVCVDLCSFKAITIEEMTTGIKGL